MPWGCSERSVIRPALRRRSLRPLLAAALVWAPCQPAMASGWLHGVFPVPAFAGYTSGFGLRLHPLAGDLRPHYGIDIAAPLGSPVRSWWGGRVQEVIRDGGCGNGLVIRSGDYEHIYCHLAGSVEGDLYRSGPVRLVRGQPVRRGALIGHVGLTGSTTGPHLHWGMRHRGRWLDPARILRAMAASRRQGEGRGGPFKVEGQR